MKALFLSDAHLRSIEDANYSFLSNFLDTFKEKIDHLFIVGDFFDFWFCRKEKLYPDFRTIVDKLIDLKNSGVQVHLCEGNHDFFLKKFFTDRHGMEVFPDWGTINLDGIVTFFSHGDTIDTADTQYLMLRKLLRSRTFYQIQEKLPPAILWKIARKFSKISKQHLAKSPDGLVEKMEAYTLEKFKEGFDAVILGHCHKPIIKQYTIDGREKTFVTLGDWISYYSYLLYENGKFTLSVYKP
jgi:UDP-2,3-diacylglucosamine hydrolase